MEFWINGVSQGTLAATIGGGDPGDQNAFSLGFLAHASGDGFFSSSEVDEFGVWNKKLSSTEIADLYNGGTGQTMVSTAATAETAATPLFTVPTSTASTFLSNVSQTLTDSGLLSIITVAIGLPLAFWLIKQVMGLISKK
jgi:hypothetical protein